MERFSKMTPGNQNITCIYIVTTPKPFHVQARDFHTFMSRPFWRSQKRNFVDKCYGFAAGTICSGVAFWENAKTGSDFNLPK
jgi:hypothetical protein